MTAEERVWYVLSHEKLPKCQILKRDAYDSDRLPGERHYIDYIITDKPSDKINWDTTDRSTPVEALL